MTFSLTRLTAATLLLAALVSGVPPLAPTAHAQDFSEEAIRKASPYKDLPGVEDPKQVKKPDDQADCTQELQMRTLHYRDRRYLPEASIVYRCERNGITAESSRPPLQKNWNPLAEQ